MKPCILIVEDEEDIRKMLKEALQKDYDIVEAESGFYGISEIVLGSQKIELIITDLNMPEFNGFEFIKDLPRTIPFIVISGYLHLPEYRENLKKLNPVAVLKKPFRLHELREAIRKGIE